MTNPNKTQTKGFAVFLSLIAMTAFYFVLAQDNDFIWGVLAIIWGVFGFFRIIDLTYNEIKAVPKFLNLPLQILFGANKREQEKSQLTLKRLNHPDVLFWLMGVMMYVFWAIYNGLMPAEIDFKSIFHLPSTVIFDEVESRVKTDLYAFLIGISYIGVMVTTVFLALTYSQSRQHLHWALIIFCPFLFIGLIGLWLSVVNFATSIFLWPDIIFLKGYGFGSPQADIILNSLGVVDSQTYFIKRFIALGSLGAYGAYVLLIPAFYMFVKILLRKGRTNLRPLMGLGCLAVLGFLDVAAISSGWVYYLLFLFMTYAVLCWGSIIRYK